MLFFTWITYVIPNLIAIYTFKAPFLLIRLLISSSNGGNNPLLSQPVVVVGDGLKSYCWYKLT